MSKIIGKARRVAAIEAEKLGLEIVSVKLIHEHGMRILQIIADKEFGLSMEDSEKLNMAIGAALDEDDILDSEYYLEVSSVGAERLLNTDREVRHAIGRYVSIKTDDGIFLGHLVEVTDDSVMIRINNKGRMSKKSFNISDIIEIRLAVKI